MSRRQDATKTAQNLQALKTLVKLESNKSCADCKRNKHPRWASWNLGVFVCIRCSGIHRGMGTHISRVKSVDLDSWTDEQLQSMLRWGNARANKYWEDKLAPGHVPAEAKIENFIRTKYESRRWVMDGPMPDPSTLDVDADDDVPLNVVQEKARLERSSSLRTSSVPAQAAPSQMQFKKPTPEVDLFGDPAPAAAPVSSASRTTAAVAPAKPSRGADSLLGFDFMGGSQSAPPSRPSSTVNSTGSGGPSRPDLKQSILSLYASAPRPANPPSAPNPSQSPPPRLSSSSAGLEDALGGLNFSSVPAAQPPPQPKSSPFANLTSPSTSASSRVTSPPPSVMSPKPAGGAGSGSFFETKKPSNPPPVSAANFIQTQPQSQPQPPPVSRGFSSSSGFGDWTGATSPPATSVSSAPKAGGSNGLSNDLFDFSASPEPTPKPAASSSTFDSPFNLSRPVQPTPPVQRNPPPAAAPSIINDDPWGSSSAWASNQGPASPPMQQSQAPTLKSAPAAPAATTDDWGSWSDSKPSTTTTAAPKVTQDEDFGGWESSTQTPKTQNPPKPPGAFDQDLFSNVWE